MGSRSMVVLEIRFERSSERAFLEYDHVIETVPTENSTLEKIGEEPGACRFEVWGGAGSL